MGSLFITPPQGAGHGSWQISAIDLHSGYAWADLVTAPAGGPLPEQLAGLAARVAEELREAGWRLEHVVTDGRRELEVPTFTRSVRALGARCRRGVSGARDTLTAIETFHRATVEQFWGPLLSDAPSGGEADLRQRLDEYVAGYNRRNAAPTA
jgi:hypothetical protein